MDIINYVSGFFDWIYHFLTVGIFDFFSQFIEWFTVKLTVWYIDAKVQSIKFAWSVAGTVLEQFNIGPVVASYVGNLSPNIAYAANHIGLFDGFNMVMQAATSSFVMRFVRF